MDTTIGLVSPTLWAVVVAQLTALSLPFPEDPGSNPVVGNFY